MTPARGRTRARPRLFSAFSSAPSLVSGTTFRCRHGLARTMRACRAPGRSFKPHPKPTTTALPPRDRLASLRSRQGLLGVPGVHSSIGVPRPPRQLRGTCAVLRLPDTQRPRDSSRESSLPAKCVWHGESGRPCGEKGMEGATAAQRPSSTAGEGAHTRRRARSATLKRRPVPRLRGLSFEAG